MIDIGNSYYKIGNKINYGGFGNVYVGIHIPTNTRVAVKITSTKYKKNTIAEYNIYKLLTSTNNVPYVIDLYEHNKNHIMIYELMGYDIGTLFKKMNSRFNNNTVSKIAFCTLNIIKSMHNNNIIHRDIKPSNFVFNYKMDKIYIIDFGLSKKYIINGKHISLGTVNNIVGTIRFAGVNSHLKITLSRRDDIESYAYMLMYLQNGKLIWQDTKETRKIYSQKMSISVNKIYKKLPSYICDIFQHAGGLSFHAIPDYNLLLSFITNSAYYNVNANFEWL
jgi:serine/threonine protein kinase